MTSSGFDRRRTSSTLGPTRSDGPLVHFISKTRKHTSVPISEVLSRLYVEISGALVTMRGTRTCLQSFTNRGTAQVFLQDGSPFWSISFRSQQGRRPPRAATTRLMKPQDWLGVLLTCTESTERSAAREKDGATVCVEIKAKYGPCRYGARCRDQGDPSHCALYSHPTEALTCSTPGCTRMPDGRYPTCCALCKSSGGEQHSSGCYEVQPDANLVVENVERSGEEWILQLRSLSSKALKASSQLCRYGCGMAAAGGKFDTCCKQCAVDFGRKRGHDANCAGVADASLIHAFRDSIDLSHLVGPADLERAPSLERTESALENLRSKAASEAEDCSICFANTLAGAPVLCSMGHSFCKDCMTRHIQEELTSKGVLPACPMSAQCNHLLTRDQVEDIVSGSDISDMVLGRFDLFAQRLGLQALGAFPCAQDTCRDWIVPSHPGKQQLVECPACKTRFCSLCKRKPYHWRVPRCEDVPLIDAKWHEWLREERDDYIARLSAQDAAYKALMDELAGKKAEQDRMLAEADSRKREFLEMEDWKAKNCKCCPKCNRVINKVDGCDSMVCGRNYHGGDVQNGCGASFNWTTAPAYTPQEAAHITKVEAKDLGPAPAERQKQYWEVDKGVWLRCAMCKDAIEGPLFLCIDCHGCCACLRCANGLGSAAGGQHLPDSHVFSILWAPRELHWEERENLVSHKLTTRRKHRRGEKLTPQETLVDMGFSEQQATSALGAAGGDLAKALERLTQ